MQGSTVPRIESIYLIGDRISRTITTLTICNLYYRVLVLPFSVREAFVVELGYVSFNCKVKVDLWISKTAEMLEEFFLNNNSYILFEILKGSQFNCRRGNTTFIHTVALRT